MSDSLPKLEDLDRDGAIQEAADRVARNTALEDAAHRGDTRAGLLRKAALGGAVVGGGLLLGLPALATGADTRSMKQDVEILNYALTLEYLEAEFYTRAETSKFPGETGQLAAVVGSHERAHVDFLVKGLGSAAVAKPTFDFKNTTTDAAVFRNTAVVLEDTGVAAYLGQSYRLKSTAYILAAASVLAVEARHSAWARSLVPSRVPSEEAFAVRASMKQVLAAVTATGFITS